MSGYRVKFTFSTHIYQSVALWITPQVLSNVKNKPLNRTSIPRYRSFVSVWPVKNLVELADGPTLYVSRYYKDGVGILFFSSRCTSDTFESFSFKIPSAKNRQMAYSEYNGLWPSET
jgi:hypothetical protein